MRKYKPSFFSGIKIHSEIFERHVQKSETFAIFFSRVLVMLFVSPAKCQKIRVFGVCENFKPLMNKNIMYKKIRHSVQHYAQSDKEQIIEVVQRTEVHQGNGWQGKNHKEIVVLFKSALIAMVVVVPVQNPQKAVHHVFMDNPGCSFHQYKCQQCD